MTPKYLNREEVPAEQIAQEKEILLAQIKNDPKNANKPDAIIAKMIDGKIGKFYTENCLVDQEFFLDEDLTVGKYVAQNGSAVITGFVRYERGEGMQKREDDFASEVAKMASGN